MNINSALQRTLYAVLSMALLIVPATAQAISTDGKIVIITARGETDTAAKRGGKGKTKSDKKGKKKGDKKGKKKRGKKKKTGQQPPAKVRGSQVGVYIGRGPALKPFAGFDPYGRTFNGGVRVAVGDVDGDGNLDVITGPGPAAGQAPVINIFSLKNNKPIEGPLSDFNAFQPNFFGGVNVAAGDVNSDGMADVIAATAAGAGFVGIYDGATGNQLANFFAFEDSYTGGVNVAAGDLDGDGRAEVITSAAGLSGGPHVRVFSAEGNLLSSIMAYDTGFSGGVRVATGDVNGDGQADIITGAGAGGGPHVKVFDGNSNVLLSNFFAFDAGFTGGVSVGAQDVNGDGKDDIITGGGSGGSEVRVFSGADGSQLAGFFAFENSFSGGVYVATPAAVSTRQDDPGEKLPDNAVSFIDALLVLKVRTADLTLMDDGCGIGGNLNFDILENRVRTAGLPDNGPVVFDFEIPGVYTANNVIIFGQRDHDGTFSAEGCDVSLHFVNQRTQGQCASHFHFNPLGTPAEALLDTTAFATCP